ncbi:MAG: hypothetical protein JST04_04505 [Bdellovibrionales bacterium]|nr:hypothetical protein [Bdellovibrionales bacterium]
MVRLLLLATLAFLVSVGSPSAVRAANFPGAFPTRNEKLHEQLEADPDRLIPRTKFFAAAVDADFFKPAYLQKVDNAYSDNPYHGNGYWMETRFEFAPTDPIRLNLKLVPWLGSSSFGYAARAELFALAGAEWDDRLFNTDWRFRFRASDLGIQSYGGGILVQDRPTNGGRVEFEHGNFAFRQTVEGTGALAVAGDLYDHHLSFMHDRIGLGVIWSPSDVSPLGEFPATGYLHAHGGIGAGTDLAGEIAGNRNAPAFRLNAETKVDTGAFRLVAKPEVRYYGRGFAGGYRGYTQQVYTGYDLQSLSYTNAINIFRTSDAAFVPAARVIAEWQAFRTVSVYLDQELGEFDYRDAPDEHYYFWDAGIRLWPTLPRRDYATIGFTNKLLTSVQNLYGPSAGTSGTVPYPVFPNQTDSDIDKPRFVKQLQFVVTLHSSF